MLSNEQNYIRHEDFLLDPNTGEIVADVNFPPGIDIETVASNGVRHFPHTR